MTLNDFQPISAIQLKIVQRHAIQSAQSKSKIINRHVTATAKA